jgi:hypothetical protein
MNGLRIFIARHSDAYEIPMPQAFLPSRFFMAFCPFSDGRPQFRPQQQRCVMLFDPRHEQHLGKLEAQLRRAQAPTAELISDVIAEACGMTPAQLAEWIKLGPPYSACGMEKWGHSGLAPLALAHKASAVGHGTSLATLSSCHRVLKRTGDCPRLFHTDFRIST